MTSLFRKPVQTIETDLAQAFSKAERILDKCDEENCELTDAEETAYKALLAEIESLARMKKRAALDTARGKPDHLFPGDNPRITALSGGTVKAFSNDRAGKEAAYKSGRFLMATLLGDEGSRTWCRDAGMDIDKSIRMAHSAGVNTAGGNSLENLANVARPTFLGYPIEVTDVYPDSVTDVLNAAVMIGFGNLTQA